MKRIPVKLSIAGILALAIIVQSCEQDYLCLNGSGDARTYDLVITPFDKITIEGPINLQITHGESFAASIKAEAEMYHAIEHKQTGDQLYVGIPETLACFNTNHGIWVNITVPELNTVQTSGESRIISGNDLIMDKLKFITSGKAEIEITGEVGLQEIVADGLITVTNFGLQTLRTRIELEGSGELEIHCTENLDIRIDGASTVKYKGQPVITKSVIGSLSLIDSN